MLNGYACEANNDALSISIVMMDDKQAEQILAREQRISRIGNLAAAMLHFDSPPEFVMRRLRWLSASTRR